MHVTEFDILLYLEGSLSPDDRKRVEEHVGRCNDCTNQFATLARLPDVLERAIPHDVDDATFEKAKGVVRRQKSGGWSSFRIFNSPLRAGLAGVSVLAVTLTIYLLIPRQEPSQFRSTDATAPKLMLFPSDGAVIAGPRSVFRWSSLTQSSVYKFSLMNDNGVTIWNWDVRDTSLVLPSSVVLIPGKTYLWRVESFLADKTLERSALHVFTYIPSQ